MSDDARGPSWWSRVFGSDGVGTPESVPTEVPPDAEPIDEARELESRLAATLEENAALQTRLGRLHEVYESVRDELAVERGQHRTLVAAHRSALDQARDFQRLVRGLEEEKHGLQEQLETKAARLRAVEAELAERTTSCGVLARRASAAERSAAATSRRCAESARRKLDQQQAEHEETRGRLEAALRVEEERSRALDAARARVRALEKEVEALTQRHDADTAARDEERIETASRLEIVRARLEKVESSVGSLEAELETERAALGRVRDTARRFTVVAADALRRCVGQRLFLPLRLAWLDHAPQTSGDLASSADELMATMQALGLCSTLEIEPRSDDVTLHMEIDPELMSWRGASALPAWLLEYACAHLGIAEGRVGDPRAPSIDAERGRIRTTLSRPVGATPTA
jgi:hypothetical protein